MSGLLSQRRIQVKTARRRVVPFPKVIQFPNQIRLNTVVELVEEKETEKGMITDTIGLVEIETDTKEDIRRRPRTDVPSRDSGIGTELQRPGSKIPTADIQ